MCGHYPRALKLFIQCGDREIDAAIEVVGKANSDTLTHQLIDFLVGEKDGVPKDPNYIYRLYMALKKYEDAAKTALIIAKQEQDMGNYHLARTIIYETIRQLEDCDINVPLQMRNQFVLLHSYEIAKSRIQAQDHMSAARLFLRVAQNVSKFPVHLVGILTATVIETKRAKLYASCYEYAVMLMSQHRKSIQPDEVRKSIEGIVRRKSMYTEDIPEETSLCPISNQPVEETLLECPTTRDAIPMCIITGKHMVLNDWCFCPNTHFPALYSEYIQYIQIEKEKNARNNDSEGNIARDPILNKNIDVIDIKLSSEEEARAYIKKYNNVKDDGTATQGKLSNYDNKEPSGNKNGKAAAGALQDKDHTSEKRSKKGVSFM